MQGHYAEVSGLLLIFYGLIATLHWWGKFRFWPLYLIGALYYLGLDINFSSLDFDGFSQHIRLSAWRGMAQTIISVSGFIQSFLNS